MNATALEAWRNRPLQVRVLDLCPLCKKLAEKVEKRVIYSGFGTRIDETCCEPCMQVVREEYNGVMCC
jgi:hypothetical protein